MLRIPGTRSGDVCLSVASDVSWSDFLLGTHRTHMHRYYWHKGKSAARVLLHTAVIPSLRGGAAAFEKTATTSFDRFVCA